MKNGASLFGKEGVFAPLLENILNAALEGEMEVHLSEPQCQNGNCRNGKMDKQVQNPLGEVTVSTSLDKKEFLKDLKTVHKAVNQETVEENLALFQNKIPKFGL